jgi:hypothetical protein
MNEQILNAYIEAALWSSVDDEGVPLDKNYKAKNIDPLTKLHMLRDVNQAKFLADSFAPGWKEYWDNDHFGYDFWLTRNGEGRGFWSRAPTNPSEEGAIGAKLSTIATSFPAVELYVGGDGVIYAL